MREKLRAPLPPSSQDKIIPDELVPFINKTTNDLIIRLESFSVPHSQTTVREVVTEITRRSTTLEFVSILAERVIKGEFVLDNS